MNSTNDWGQFIDLEKGLYISDKSTGVVNSHVKQEVMERNNLPFVQTINHGNLPFTRQCVIYFVYTIAFIYDNVISQI